MVQVVGQSRTRSVTATRRASPRVTVIPCQSSRHWALHQGRAQRRRQKLIEATAKYGERRTLENLQKHMAARYPPVSNTINCKGSNGCVRKIHANENFHQALAWSARHRYCAMGAIAVFATADSKPVPPAASAHREHADPWWWTSSAPSASVGTCRTDLAQPGSVSNLSAARQRQQDCTGTVCQQPDHGLKASGAQIVSAIATSRAPPAR